MITVKNLEEWGACPSAIDVLRANGGKCGIKKAIRLCDKNDPNWLTWLMSTPVCGELIRAGVDPNTHDQWNNTPLHFAAFRGRREMCQSLLNYGANVNARNARGCTPLSYAEHLKNTNTSKLLKEHGGTL